METELEIVYNRLNQKYNSGRISVCELAVELQISTVTIYRNIKTGTNIPEFQRGEGKNSRIYFTTFAVAKFLLKSIKIYSK